MAASSIDGLYYEFHTPLGLKTLIEQLVTTQSERRNAPSLSQGSVTNREWFSKPRPSSDSTTEVITARFKLPLSVNHIKFDILRVSCRAELWYLDRLNNWRPLLNNERLPVEVTVASSNATSWYTFESSVYPIVAQAVQIRVTRVPDPQLGINSYVVGLRKTLIRRNVYDRSQGILPFEESQDPLGNVINKYVADWDASKAIDDKPFTFWKSAPQPDPQAVCSLYLDTRNSDGSAQYMDGLFLDPVYSNQSLNIYYSSDENDTETSRLSPVTLRPDQVPVPDSNATNQEITQYEAITNDLSTNWLAGRGRWDTSSSPSGKSRYRVPARWGPMINQDMWVGIEWIPDFDSASPPADTPVLFGVTPEDENVPGQFYPTVLYDSGAGHIALRFTEKTAQNPEVRSYSVALDPGIVKDTPVRIAVGWSYNPSTVYIDVQNRLGESLASFAEVVPNNFAFPALPENISLDGQIGVANFRGTLTAHILKKENYSGHSADFLANPIIYVNPDPALPSADGTIPSTSLDNALFAVDWTLQPHGSGGTHETSYTGKTWRPIWRDYFTQRGKLFFPQAISAKYLKLEFTNLTEESYPVYDTGIKVNYKVYPVSVQQNQIVPNKGVLGNVAGLLSVGAQTVLGAVGTVNWLNPQTVANAVNTIYGPTVNPVQIQVGPGYTTNTLPNTAELTVADTLRTELSSPYVYRRGFLDPQSMAASHIYYSGFTEWSQTLSNASEIIGQSFQNSFTPVQNFITTATAAPVQGDDWWIFPGGTLRMPAVIMRGLTALTETVLGRKPSSETRMRFNTESIHRYETKTLTRDAAVAYFAGVREVQPILTTYTSKADPTKFAFDTYNEAQGWVLSNITRQAEIDGQGNTLDTGPMTTAGRLYEIPNPDFDRGLGTWAENSGTWEWDGNISSGWSYPGTARATATGTHTELRSPTVIAFPTKPNMTPGKSISFKVFARWSDLIVTDTQPGIQLGLVTYDNEGVEIADDIVLDQVTHADWSAHSSSDYVSLQGTWLVPEGVTDVKVRLAVTQYATAGSVWFDTLIITPEDTIVGSASQTFTTASTFSKLRCQFTDSGTVRSDSMWQRLQGYTDWIEYDLADSPDNYPGGQFGVTPDAAPALNADGSPYEFGWVSQQAYVLSRMQEIRNQGGIADENQYRLPVTVEDTELAYYTSFIGLDEDGANWADNIATWKDSVAPWGAPNSQVSISVDPNRLYQNQRVIQFSRGVQAGEAGVQVRQWTNFVPEAAFRICARWYKPRTTGNAIKLRLRRASDGVIIHEETITNPAVGYWHEYATDLHTLPSSSDQVYNVEFVNVGDEEDSIFLSDLWCEISHVRYFVQLGSATEMWHDVTDLRYANSGIVSRSVPVNEFTVEARILTPRATLYGCVLQPVYLK